MLNRIRREDVVKEALEWEGTKWQHQASLKGVATDCIGFVAGVYRNLGKDVEFKADYPATWHIFNDYQRLYNEAKGLGLIEISPEEMKPGDILFFQFGKMPANHVGLYIGDGFFLHAYTSVHKVVKSRVNGTWQKCLYSVMKVPEVID